MTFKFSLVVTAIAISSIISTPANSETKHPTGDGKLVIYNYHLGEVLETSYRRGNKFDKRSLEDITHIFRSRSDNKEIPIDTALVELIDHIQDHFQADSIELISGYRSPELNKQLKQESINVAEESMHLKGMAADIHLDEATEEAIVDYVRTLKSGGVGFYPAWDFVHVDTGEVRNWDLPDKKGILLTAMRKGSEWQVVTDKDVYLPEEKIEFELTNITRTAKKFIKELTVQVFRRGKWKTLTKISTCDDKKLASGKVCVGVISPSEIGIYGKFRVAVSPPTGFPHLEVHSNEFYRKKL